MIRTLGAAGVLLAVSGVIGTLWAPDKLSSGLFFVGLAMLGVAGWARRIQDTAHKPTQSSPGDETGC